MLWEGSRKLHVKAVLAKKKKKVMLRVRSVLVFFISLPNGAMALNGYTLQGH